MARHHTVPEVYLKGFYDHAMVAKKQHVLWLYRRDRKTVPRGADAVGDVVSVSLPQMADDGIVTGELQNATLCGLPTEAMTCLDDLDVGIGGVNAPTRLARFVWSDMSAAPHNDTVGNDNADDFRSPGDATASDDWTNGVFVQMSLDPVVLSRQ